MKNAATVETICGRLLPQPSGTVQSIEKSTPAITGEITTSANPSG
jgi:hypothetical protein